MLNLPQFGGQVTLEFAVEQNQVLEPFQHLIDTKTNTFARWTPHIFTLNPEIVGN